MCNKNFVTNGAVLTFGKTGFGAGRSNCNVDHFGVTECVNFVCYVSVTTSAGVGGITRIFTSGSSNNCFVSVLMFGFVGFSGVVRLFRTGRFRFSRFRFSRFSLFGDFHRSGLFLGTDGGLRFSIETFA